ncbi:MAG TPA: ATPase domain-containing protein [Candidatus Limnocylindrales bacterium]|nr:ATPase domain-containing protein [Candidatus Limnocylindrales bacterium]
MTERQKVIIRTLPTGVPGLDQVLGGGLPEYSFNLIAGGPGTGKTTLAHQIMFANTSPDRPALYFTVLGEPPIKMLRYQQQFNFFDLNKVDSSIHFINLSQEVLDKDLSKVLESIVREVEKIGPSIVVVDSFRTVVQAVKGVRTGETELQNFIQRLALYLTTWQATTFLVGEYPDEEIRQSPVFTVADGILWLFQSVECNSTIRKLQVIKMRGQAPLLGMHTFRITQNGLKVFPRMVKPIKEEKRPIPSERISTGVPGLDEMMNGGIPLGDSVILAGPSGSGKTVLATQFIHEGLRQGEPGVVVLFEERPQRYLERAKAFGFDLAEMIRQDRLRILYLRQIDLLPDEALQKIQKAVEQIAARRVVINSLSGFEVALAPTFRKEFQESLYRMVEALTEDGVTVLMTLERDGIYNELRLNPYVISFLTDDIILQRYIEMDGQLKKVITVVKMRNSPHSKDLRVYEITSQGLVVGEILKGYQGIISGISQPQEILKQFPYPGLIDQEMRVLQTLLKLGETSATMLAQRTALDPPDLARALDRLLTLRYAVKVEEGDRILYRPLV